MSIESTIVFFLQSEDDEATSSMQKIVTNMLRAAKGNFGFHTNPSISCNESLYLIASPGFPQLDKEKRN